MSFIQVNEDHRDLFPLQAGKCAKCISSSSSKFRARQFIGIMGRSSVREKEFSLITAYDEGIEYEKERALVNSQRASAK